ncbi:MAG: hypothetical protein RI953_664 [Pseudomonadota bacterium]|jgi:mannose-6-phosphate isomerase class I
MSLPFLKFDPYNFVPVSRTPWAGQLIGITKVRALPAPQGGWPERIGESWEVSTDAQFPSKVTNANEDSGRENLLGDLLNRDPAGFLGAGLAQKFGSHCPLLLKWLNAKEPLSVQVHPAHSHPLLKAGECGKPESWLVMNNSNGQGYVFLGFKEGLSKDDIMSALRQDKPRDVMHVVYPKVGDYISIPTGCVHATGPGVLIAEPQYVLPGKSGKTWRISDWGRRYNSQGELDPQGQPRELHIDEALSAIDWNLPRGTELEKLLIQRMEHKQIFSGDIHNPFPVQIFSQAGIYEYKPLVDQQFSLVTCWEGKLQLIAKSGEAIVLRAGESGLVAASAGAIKIALAEPLPLVRPECAFFAFNAQNE